MSAMHARTRVRLGSVLLFLACWAGCAVTGAKRGTTAGDAVRIEGVLDLARNGMGFLDGEQVALAPGAAIEGRADWSGQMFTSFDEVPLGALVEVAGERSAGGSVVATRVTAEPDLFTRPDSLVHSMLASGLALPPPTQLSGGRVEIGGLRFQLVQDLEVQAYVTRIGYRLVPRHIQVADPDAPGTLLFRFYVIEDDSFNAFAFPDGSVFVHTGLMKALENEAQLAAVLGHEIAHAVYEHGRKRFTRSQRSQMLGFLAQDVGLEEGTVKRLVFGTGVLSNVYSRNDEDQADRVGLHYMVEAGYDPREAVKVWARLADLTDKDGLAGAAQDVETFLYSSHSAARARENHLRTLVELYHFEASGQIGLEEYQRVVRGL